MRYVTICAALAVSATLTACATKPSDDAPDAAIQAAVYRPAAPALTLLTIINNRTGSGAHTALFVEGSQGVLFDPAGSFKHPSLPERGDVLFGMSPRWVKTYMSAHARKEFHVVSQRIPVSAAQAELALKLVTSHGAVPDALCAMSTSTILAKIPGLEGIQTGYYPKNLMAQIDGIAGVQKSTLFENDEGDVLDGVNAQILADQE